MKINVIFLTLLTYAVSFNSLFSFDKLFIKNNTDSNAQLRLSFKESNCISFIVLRSKQTLQLDDKILHQIKDIKLSTYGTRGLLSPEHNVIDSKELSKYLGKPGCSFIAIDSKWGWKGPSWTVNDLKSCSGQEDSLLDNLSKYSRKLLIKEIRLSDIKIDEIRKLFNLSSEYNALDFIPILFHPYASFPLTQVIRNLQVPKIKNPDELKKAIFSYMLLKLYDNKLFNDSDIEKLQDCVKVRAARLNVEGLKYYINEPKKINEFMDKYKKAIENYILHSDSSDQIILGESEINDNDNDNSWEVIDIKS